MVPVTRRFHMMTACCLLLFFSPPLCYASFISMSTDITTQVTNGVITVACDVTNNGDEAAHEVSLEAGFGDEQIVKPPVARVPSGKTATFTFTYAPRIEFSRIVIPVTIRYKDANHYGFSAVSFAAASNKKASPPAVFGRFEDLSISTKGLLSLKLKSLDQNAHTVDVKIVAPRELTVSNMRKTVNIPGDADTRVNFGIENFSAIPPSTYAVLGIVSEERKGGRYDQAFVGKVAVFPEKQLFSFLANPHIIWAIAGLLMAYIAYLLLHRMLSRGLSKGKKD